MSDRISGTPGVYVQELDSIPAGVKYVPTAVPAFVGYTPRADYAGKSCRNKAIRVNSMAEFMAIFCFPESAPGIAGGDNFNPQFYLSKGSEKSAGSRSVKIGGSWYEVSPDPDTIYYLYNSVRLFFANGGGDAYIVSVGDYGPASREPMADATAPVVNGNVRLAQLLAGLEQLQAEVEPTLYLCPEATLLSAADNGALMAAMLQQAQLMQTAVCLFDVIGGRAPDPVLYTLDIQNFRNSTGNQSLDRGICYYPFVCSSIVQSGEVDFLNLFGGDSLQLHAVLNSTEPLDTAASGVLRELEASGDRHVDRGRVHQVLLGSSETYRQLMQVVMQEVNLLPASGAMAGLYAMNDNDAGVWNSPANVSPLAVDGLPLRITDDEQQGLNVDPVTGKSINALRIFQVSGVLVWGARTLDGNSQDWRYISMRRTAIWLEQSIGRSLGELETQVNDASVWTRVRSMLSGFLTDVWKSGGLMGNTAQEAFSVAVGLGETMTAEDVLQGIIRVSVKVALQHPGEFIVITFQQEVAGS